MVNLDIPDGVVQLVHKVRQEKVEMEVVEVENQDILDTLVGVDKMELSE
jgi:hypothetical protein